MHRFIHQSKFQAGCNFFINLASEVPPVVENLGLTLVNLFIIFFAEKIVLFGFVKNESPFSKYFILNLHLLFYINFL